MAINKISQIAFKNLKPDIKERLVADGGGMFIRIRSLVDGGAISFRYKYRIEGKQKWVNIGAHPTIGLKDAREKRNLFKLLLLEGKDPALETAITRHQNKIDQETLINVIESYNKRPRMCDLFDRWQKIELNRHKDKGNSVRENFNRHVMPAIGDKFACEVKKSDIGNLLDKLISEEKFRTAKMTLSQLRQMFQFGIERDIVASDPTSAFKKSKIGPQEQERERFLNENEILELKKKLPHANLLKTTEIAIWILLSTGCRISELVKNKWENVNFTERELYIPKDISKNGRDFKIHLSNFAIQQFKQLQSYSGNSIWLYPNSKNTDYVCTKSITKQISDRQLPDGKKRLIRRSIMSSALIIGNEKWVPHDLRRTCATLMTKLGVDPYIADKCLNHIDEKSVKRVYLKYDYTEEKKQAWIKLGAKLEKLIS